MESKPKSGTGDTEYSVSARLPFSGRTQMRFVISFRNDNATVSTFQL